MKAVALTVLSVSTLAFGLAPKSDVEKIADRIDSPLQKAFENIWDGKFGVSRLPRKGPHIANPANGKGLLSAEDSIQWRARLFLAGNKTKKLGKGSFELRYAGNLSYDKGQKSEEEYRKAVADRPSEDALKKLIERNFGSEKPMKLDEWTVVSRPIRSLGEACTKCHTESGDKDALGYLIYTFKKQS